MNDNTWKFYVVCVSARKHTVSSVREFDNYNDAVQYMECVAKMACDMMLEIGMDAIVNIDIDRAEIIIDGKICYFWDTDVSINTLCQD